MATNLMNVFKNVDLQGVGKTAANIVSLAFKPNKITGAKIARAVLVFGPGGDSHCGPGKISQM